MNIYDVVDAQRASLMKREYQTVKGVVRAYEVAEKKVEASIRLFQAKILAAQSAGLTPSLAWYYQEARLENVLREIRGHLDEFSSDALEFAEKGRADSYKLGAVHAVRLSEAQVYGDVAGLHAGAFQNAQALLSRSSPLKALFDNISPTATAKARDAFAKGVAEGWNPRKLGANLKKEIKEVSKDRAVLIARTEMIRSYRTANKNVYENNADVLRGWRWTCAKTKATCALCLGMDGQIFPVSKTLSSHSACRCSMVPLPDTDFGGVQPQDGSEYFAKLSPEDQDRILGKTKGRLYREGKITLKDNIDFTDHPDWGRQPRPRRLVDLNKEIATGTTPSKLGPVKLSGYEPRPGRKLSDLLDANERKAADPVKKALRAWDEAPQDKRGRRVGIKADRANYKKLVPKDFASSMESDLVELDIKNLVASTQYPADAKVRAFIESLGDGPDLPVVFKDKNRYWIHDNDSLARIEAKRLLGQTKTTVRLFDAESLKVPLDPFQVAKDELKALGVKTVTFTDEVVDKPQALAWVKERIIAAGHAPEEVLIGGDQTRLTKKTLSVGRNFGSLGRNPGVDEVQDYVLNSVLSLADKNIVTDKARLAFKAQRIAVTENVAENIEASLIRERLGVKLGSSEKPLYDFGGQNYDLFSVRAFSGLDEAVEEMVAVLRRGEYVRGSLPDFIEGPVLKAYADIFPLTNFKELTRENLILGLNIGGQGGSNPGGSYLGRDGVKRYVKFYTAADRAEAEHIANQIYKANGIDVPKTTLFKSTQSGLTAIASDILEGQTVQALGGVSALSVAQAEQVLEGYAVDALLANWDVVGASADNLMVLKGGQVVRIDNGGTFIFRAQGGDKPDDVLQKLGDWFSLGSSAAKGFSKYDGQLLPFIKRVAKSSSADMADIEKTVLEAHGKKLLKWLHKTVDPKTVDKVQAWEWYLRGEAPSLSAKAARRMAEMMEARARLLEERLQYLKVGPPKTKPLGKDLKALLKAPAAPWEMKGQNFEKYDEVIAKHLPKAHGRMSEPASKAAYKYAGHGYKADFNEPARRGAMTTDIKRLDEAIKANLEGAASDFRVKRYLSGYNTNAKWHNFTAKDVGTIISDKAFLSTSLYEEFSWSGDVILEINIRKGERRFTAPAASGKSQPHKGEHEFILARDLPLLVQKVFQRNGKTVIQCELLPEGITIDKSLIKYALNAFRDFKL